MSDVALAKHKIAYYREPPHGATRFVVEQFQITPDPWQEDVLEAWTIGAPETAGRIGRLSLQAAAGVGKSAVMTWCAWHFLACQCRDEHSHPKGLATGITDRNLKDNFWAEMARWQGVSPWLSYAFKWGDTRIHAVDHPETWFLGRRNWPKSGTVHEQGATLSGLHGAAVACFVDESGAIPGTVLRAGEQALSELGVQFGRLMQAGNPISLEGMLYLAASKLRSMWTIVIVTNDPDDPRRSPRGDIEWARQQIALYGRDNPWVQAYILGKFPPASLNTLLGHEDVMSAMQRHLTPDQYDWAQKRLGIDVARFGDDRSVIAPRQGLACFKPIIMRNVRTTELAARAFMAKQRWGSEAEFVDESGFLGAGVVDNLIAAGVPAVPVQFGGKPIDPRYKNRRAEMWITMADAIKRGAALPHIDDLVEELTSPTYIFHNGVLQLEEKDQIKKRIGRSPDIGDAIALTYALPDMPGGVMEKLRGNKVETYFDAYAEATGPNVARAATEWEPFR